MTKEELKPLIRTLLNYFTSAILDIRNVGAGYEDEIKATEKAINDTADLIVGYFPESWSINVPPTPVQPYYTTTIPDITKHETHGIEKGTLFPNGVELQE